MAIFDALAHAAADLLAHGAGKAMGRTFKLRPEQARRMGEFAVIALIVGAGLVVTLVYS